MPEKPAGERVIPASQRKRDKARRRGQVPRSTEMNVAATFLAALLALRYLGGGISNRLVGTVENYIEASSSVPLSTSTFHALVLEGALLIGAMLLPLVLVIMVAGVTVNILQVGFIFSGKALEPNLNKLNPIEGLGRFFKPRSLVDLIKAFLKMAIVSAVFYYTLRDAVGPLASLMASEPVVAWTTVAAISFRMGVRVGLAMVALAVLDYGYQRWQHERDLMMTREEARQELKDLEGDPQIRARVRNLRRQMAMQRMMAAIPEAEVVVTNPTLIAVALRYDHDKMNAPRVVAKGMRLIAEKIRTIAIEHRVPIVENKPLAQALHKSVEIEQEIPPNLYKAVAEVLAYVYQIETRAEKLAHRPAA